MYGPRERLGQPCRLSLRLRPPGGFSREVAAVHKFQGKKRPAVVLAYFIDLHDVGLLQPRYGCSFRAKALSRGRIVVQSGEHHLERHWPFEGTLSGVIDNAHATAPQLSDDLIAGHNWKGNPRRPTCGAASGARDAGDAEEFAKRRR